MNTDLGDPLTKGTDISTLGYLGMPSFHHQLTSVGNGGYLAVSIGLIPSYI